MIFRSIKNAIQEAYADKVQLPEWLLKTVSYDTTTLAVLEEDFEQEYLILLIILAPSTFYGVDND